MICKMATRYPKWPQLCLPQMKLSHLPKTHFSSTLLNQETKYSPCHSEPKPSNHLWRILPFHHLLHLLKNDSSFMMSLGFCLTPFWLCHYALMIQYMNYYNLLLNGHPRFKFHQHAKILNITAKLIFLKYHLHYVTHLSTKSGKNVLIFFKDLHN